MSDQDTRQTTFATASEVEDVLLPFPPEVLVELGGHLGVDIGERSETDMFLRTIAATYRSRRRRVKTERASQKTRFGRLGAALREVSEAQANIEAGDFLVMFRASAAASYKEFQKLNQLTHFWTEVVEGIAAAPLPRSREKNAALLDACRSLGHIYIEITGEKLTHTTYAQGLDTLSPQSAFGRFAVSFFAHVNPNLRPKELNAPLKQLRNRQLFAEKAPD